MPDSKIATSGPLRATLIAQGHRFKSETDSEVLAHLIESRYEGDLIAAVRETLAQVHGAYALGVISSEAPNRLIFAELEATLAAEGRAIGGLA